MGACPGLGRVGQYRVGGVLGDHVDRRDRKEAGNPGEHGGIDNPEPFRPARAERRIEHGVRISVAADLPGARGMMAPGSIRHELVDAGVRLEIDASHDLRMPAQLGRAFDQWGDDSNSFPHRDEILCGAGSRADLGTRQE
jgi:hypothetical protein